MNTILDPNGASVTKLDISYLRVFSCRAYVTIILEDRVKLEKMAPRSQIGKLISYEGNSLYLVMLPLGSVSR